MPPGSLSTLAVMKPGPNTARKASSLYFRTPNPATRRGRLRSLLKNFLFMGHECFLRWAEWNVTEYCAGCLLLENQEHAEDDHSAGPAPCHPVEEFLINVLAP